MGFLIGNMEKKMEATNLGFRVMLGGPPPCGSDYKG